MCVLPHTVEVETEKAEEGFFTAGAQLKIYLLHQVEDMEVELCLYFWNVPSSPQQRMMSLPVCFQR